MKSVLAVMFAVLACTLAACASPAPAPKASATMQITLSQSCGYITSCADYQIQLTPDGSFHYEGIKHVTPLGVRDGSLGPSAWAKAQAALAAAKWDQLSEQLAADNKSPCMPDSPRAVIKRRDTSGAEKVLVYNLGCNNAVGNTLLNALQAAMPRPAEAAQQTPAMIKLYESTCYFPGCIPYEIEVHPDGGYILTDPKVTSPDPPRTGSLGADVWAKAEAALADAKFSTMPEQLTVAQLQRPGGLACINDLPDAEFTRRGADGSTKTVRYSTGCDVPAARKLLFDLRALFKHDELVED